MAAAMPLKDPRSGGAGKQAIAASGGGKKTLKTWRSMNEATKTQAKEYAKANPGGLTAVVQGYREARTQRGVNPTSGQAPGSKPGPTSQAMEQRRMKLAGPKPVAKPAGPSVPEMKDRRKAMAKAAKAAKAVKKVKRNIRSNDPDALGKAVAKRRAGAKPKMGPKPDYEAGDYRAMTRKARTTMRAKGKK